MLDSEYKGSGEIKLNEMINSEGTKKLMESDKVTSDDLIQIILSAKEKLGEKSA